MNRLHKMIETAVVVLVCLLAVGAIVGVIAMAWMSGGWAGIGILIGLCVAAFCYVYTIGRAFGFISPPQD